MRTDQTIKKQYKVTLGVMDYNVPFPLYEVSDVAVYTSLDSGKTDMKLTYGEHYIVSIAQNHMSGTVTLLTVLPENSSLVLVSNLPYTQELDLNNVSTINTEDTETQLDRDCQQRQQLKEKLDRAVKMPITSSKTPEQFTEEFFDAADDAKDAAARATEMAARIVSKNYGGSFSPYDIIGGPSYANIILRSDQRGTGTYSRATVQSAVYDPIGNQIFMLHGKDFINESIGSRYMSISRHPLSRDIDVGTSGISSDIDEVGHQGLAVECLPTGGIKLWSSHNYGLHGGTALRFDYTDSADISNIQEYVLVNSSASMSLTPCISYDQRFLLVGYWKNSKLYVRIFELAKLRDGGPRDYSSAYFAEFEINPVKASGLIGFQDMACDGWHVYVLASDTLTSKPAAIYCYTIQGELVAKNKNVTLGFAESTAASSTFCEAESLLILPVNNAPQLCVGVNVASSSGDAPTKNFHIFALNGAGWEKNPELPNLSLLKTGDDVKTLTQGGFYQKIPEATVTNWPDDMGTNGLLLNFGKNEPNALTFQMAIRLGVIDDNNYQMAYRCNYLGRAERWWYPATMFARCHVTADGTANGRMINIDSVTQVDTTHYTVVLKDAVAVSSVIIVTPSTSSSGVTGSGSIAEDGKTISVTLSSAVAFSLAVL